MRNDSYPELIYDSCDSNTLTDQNICLNPGKLFLPSPFACPHKHPKIVCFCLFYKIEDKIGHWKSKKIAGALVRTKRENLLSLLSLRKLHSSSSDLAEFSINQKIRLESFHFPNMFVFLD